MSIKSYKILFIMTFCIVTFNVNVHAKNKQKDTVNILTWWGYLDSNDLISMVEKECNVKISYDEYYTNIEFLRRWKTQRQNYDIVIFSETIYDLVKDEIALKTGSLYELSQDYHPIIKEQYERYNFPPNVTFYIHSLTGFLWNPDVVSLTKNEKLYSIFEKAKDKITIILDDPAEAEKLISLGYYEAIHGEKEGKGYKNKLIPLTVKNFKKLIQQSKVYIVNDYNKIYTNKDFAFAFIWSGDAVTYLKKSEKKYKFLVHDNLSYVSSDLLAHLNHKDHVIATAKALMSKKAMGLVQNNEYYFSPYLDISDVNDPVFLKVYKQFIKELPNLSWVRDALWQQSPSRQVSWDKIKLDVNKNVVVTMSSIEKIKGEYSEAYCTLLELAYGKGYMSEGGAQAVDELFTGINISGKKVLDIGAGLGGAAFHIAKKYNAKVIGLEINPWMVSEAKRRRPEKLKNIVDFVFYDTIDKLPFHDKEFDIIFSKGVLVHLDNKLPLFEEIHRIMKDDGILIINDWLSPLKNKWGKALQEMCELEDLTLFAETENNYLRLLKDSGFSKIDMQSEDNSYIKYNRSIAANLRKKLASHKSMGIFTKEEILDTVSSYELIAESIEKKELLVRKFICRK